MRFFPQILYDGYKQILKLSQRVNDDMTVPVPAPVKKANWNGHSNAEGVI